MHWSMHQQNKVPLRFEHGFRTSPSQVAAERRSVWRMTRESRGSHPSKHDRSHQHDVHSGVASPCARAPCTRLSLPALPRLCSWTDAGINELLTDMSSGHSLLPLDDVCLPPPYRSSRCRRCRRSRRREITDVVDKQADAIRQRHEPPCSVLVALLRLGLAASTAYREVVVYLESPLRPVSNGAGLRLYPTKPPSRERILFCFR